MLDSSGAGRSKGGGRHEITAPHHPLLQPVTLPHLTLPHIQSSCSDGGHPIPFWLHGLTCQAETDLTHASMNGLLKRRTISGSRFGVLAVMGAIDGPRYGLDFGVP